MINLFYDNQKASESSYVLGGSGYFTVCDYHVMANVRVLMEVRVVGQTGRGRTVEVTRPGKQPWTAALPVVLDQGKATAALADYVTAQYLVELPKESIRLGWETVYALVRAALMEANDTANDLPAGS